MKNPTLQKDGNFRLVPHRPARRAVMLVLLLLVISGVAGIGYWVGVSRSSLDAEYLRALVRRDRSGEEQIAALRAQLVDADLARQVDRQAAESLRETITALRNEIAELREEAALYRNMMDPAGAQAGLRITEFELTPGLAPREFRYHVLLTRADVEGDPVRGVLDLEVRGVTTVAGRRQARTLRLKDLAKLDAYPLPFRFRYFQGVSGELTLPADFEPAAVLIRLTPAGRDAVAVRREFQWRPTAD